ncbi:MFS general substrate transporter [Pseudohyphozyma bogoriensis]|nr:MFS general substrate transporter [Pseudohyphozyma bogoriensis]
MSLNVQHHPQELKDPEKSDASLASLPDGDVVELTVEQKKAERRFVWKLDLFFLTYGWLSYVFKYLDQSNISNAYVSGMQTDLALYGNQLNYFTTYFNIGYILILYPSIIIISRIGPHWWLPSLELIWGILTACLSLVKDYKQVYVIRAFMGLAEGSAWPGWFTLLSAWYTPQEVALRMSLYNIAQSVASMFAGVLQAAMYTHLNGWMLLLNGIMTIVVALAGYLLIPGFPTRPNPLARWYLTPEGLDIAQRRNARIKRVDSRPLTFKTFFAQFLRWELWVMGIGVWVLGGLTTPITYFNLYLKSLTKADGTKEYSVAQLNYIPTGGAAIAIVFMLVLPYLSDKTGKRAPFLIFNSLLGIFSSAVIAARPANRSFYMAGYFLMYAVQAGFLVLCAWISDVCGGRPELRTVIYASGTCISYILSATYPLKAYPASQAPNWKIGAKMNIGTFAVSIPVILLAVYLSRKQARFTGTPSRFFG